MTHAHRTTSVCNVRQLKTHPYGFTNVEPLVTGAVGPIVSKESASTRLLLLARSRLQPPFRADTRFPDSTQLSTLVVGAAPFVPDGETAEA